VPDPRRARLTDPLGHVVASPYSRPPEPVAYQPTTSFTLRAVEGELLREWDGKMIGTMPGIWRPDYPITIGLTNPWSDPARPFLNFDILEIFHHSNFATEIMVHLRPGQL
jgi:hypothetical protein